MDDPSLYAGRYPHLRDAHRLRGRGRQVDEGAFELGLATLVNGFVALYPQVAVAPPADRP